MPIAQPAAACS